MITQETLNRLKELEAKATPGPWEPFTEYWCNPQGPDTRTGCGPIHQCYEYPGGIGQSPEAEADAAFIAESRNALPALLAEIERLRAVEAKLKEALEFYGEGNIGCNDPYCGSSELDDVTDTWVDVGTRAKRVLTELYPEGTK